MIFVGLDLGQRHDHSAIAVVEAAKHAMIVRHVERVMLGTPWSGVVERVRQIVQNRLIAGCCQLIVDATGVGAPVVELLRNASLRCDITAVTITAADREAKTPNGVNVPKRDLITGLQLALESGELTIARSMREAGALVRELIDVKMKGNRIGADAAGQHDDLVIAVALAVWKGRQPKKRMNFSGNQRLF